MATKKNAKPKKIKTPKTPIKVGLSKQQKIILGSLLMIIGVGLLISFASYFFTWQEDQSLIGSLTDREEDAKNLLSKLGSGLGHFFVAIN